MANSDNEIFSPHIVACHLGAHTSVDPQRIAVDGERTGDGIAVGLNHIRARIVEKNCRQGFRRKNCCVVDRNGVDAPKRADISVFAILRLFARACRKEHAKRN